MKKIIMIFILITNINAWEINTHRAIDKLAIEKSANLKSFVDNAGIENANYRNEIFEKYRNIKTGGTITYFDYINKKYSNDGVSKWGQTFKTYKYKNLLEAGSILEDSEYSGTALFWNGRFNNHFYDAQNNGHKLSWGWGARVNALDWASGNTENSDVPYNEYSYYMALDYFQKAFTEEDPKERRKYQAKMLVSVGNLMHMVNDMNVPAHVRDDSHPFTEPLEIWARGGEDGSNKNIGFHVVGNTIASYSAISQLPDNRVPKQTKFSDFMKHEADWTATHFFSADTIFTKRLPSDATTYEEYAGSRNGVDKYYVMSNERYGTTNASRKIGIRIKSYITRGVKKYHTTSEYKILQDKTTTFQGDYTVLQENAKILIPRAIGNARNFLDYFFRGQISVDMNREEIVVKNISNTSLVANKSIGNFGNSAGQTDFPFKLMYEDRDGTRHPFLFKYDVENMNGIVYIGSVENPPTVDGFATVHGLGAGDTVHLPIILDDDYKQILRTRKIIMIYDDNIGTQRGLAVSEIKYTPLITATRN